jgi:hypothetical protein
VLGAAASTGGGVVIGRHCRKGTKRERAVQAERPGSAGRNWTARDGKSRKTNGL